MSGITTARQIRYATLDDPVSAAFLDDTVRDVQRELDTLDALKLVAMKRPVAMMTVFTFSVPVSTVTTVNFTNEDVDTHGMINLGTNAQRITVSASSGPGMYYVQGFSTAFNSGSWTLGELGIFKNGTVVVRKKYYNFNGTTSCRLQAGSLVYLGTVGDFVDIRLYHEGGATDNVSVTTLKAFKLTS